MQNNQQGQNNAPKTSNADMLQSVISDNLFPTIEHISDVKQVIEEMTRKSQALTQPQIKALLLLKTLNNNTLLHGDTKPYDNIIKDIENNYKVAVASPEYYLDVINELIPKPPKPIIMTGDGKVIKGDRR